MDKAKLGKRIFIGSLFLAIVIFIIVFAWSLSQPKDTDEQVASTAMINYLVLFYVFTTVIPLGALCRETLGYPYNKKKIRIKLIVLAGLIIAGTLIFILVHKANIYQYTTIASALLLMYIITPTEKDSTKTPNEKV